MKETLLKNVQKNTARVAVASAVGLGIGVRETQASHPDFSPVPSSEHTLILNEIPNALTSLEHSFFNYQEQETQLSIRALHLVSPDTGLLLSEIAEVDTNFITNEYYPQVQALVQRVSAYAQENGISLTSTDVFLPALASLNGGEPEIQATLVPTPTNQEQRLISAYITVDGQQDEQLYSGGVLFLPNQEGGWDEVVSNTREMVTSAYGVSVPEGMVVYPVFDPGEGIMTAFTRSLDGVIPPQLVSEGRVNTTGTIEWETYIPPDHAGEYAERIGQVERRSNVRWENGGPVEGDVLIHDVFSYNGVTIFMEMPVAIDPNFTGYVPDSLVLRPAHYNRFRESIDEYFGGESENIHLIYIPDWDISQDSRDYLFYQFLNEHGDPTSAFGLKRNADGDIYVNWYVNVQDYSGTSYDMTPNQQLSGTLPLTVSIARNQSNVIMNPFARVLSDILLGNYDSFLDTPEFILDTTSYP